MFKFQSWETGWIKSLALCLYLGLTGSKALGLEFFSLQLNFVQLSQGFLTSALLTILSGRQGAVLCIAGCSSGSVHQLPVAPPPLQCDNPKVSMHWHCPLGGLNCLQLWSIDLNRYGQHIAKLTLLAIAPGSLPDKVAGSTEMNPHIENNHTGIGCKLPGGQGTLRSHSYHLVATAQQKSDKWVWLFIEMQEEVTGLSLWTCQFVHDS